MESISEIFNRQENLVEELQPYLQNIGSFKALRHPLVYSVPHSEHMNAFVNEQYSQKVLQINECVDSENYTKYVFLHERPYRLHAFLNISLYLTDKQYWTLLRDIWVDSENIWQNKQSWKNLLLSPRKNKSEFMNKEERKYLKSLPSNITVFRGYDEKKGDPEGFSYSLNPDIAKKFASRFSKNPVIKTRDLKKSEIFAYLQTRNEEEIIVI